MNPLLYMYSKILDMLYYHVSPDTLLIPRYLPSRIRLPPSNCHLPRHRCDLSCCCLLRHC